LINRLILNNKNSNKLLHVINSLKIHAINTLRNKSHSDKIYRPTLNMGTSKSNTLVTISNNSPRDE